MSPAEFLATTVQVVECDCCAGRGVVRAHLPHNDPTCAQVITCPVCAGLGARLTPRETA